MTSVTGTATANATTSATAEPSTDANCTKYHKVVDGDSCASIEKKYGITAAEVSAPFPHGFPLRFICSQLRPYELIGVVQ